MRTRLTAICLLAALAATALAAQPTVTSLSPSRNSFDAAAGDNLKMGFSTNMASPAANDVSVFSNMRGKLAGNISGGGTSTLTFDPTKDMLPGEEINVTMTNALQSQGGTAMANASLWQFRAKVASNSPSFDKYSWATGVSNGWGTKLGDLDGDGDLDMVCVGNGQNYYYINDGNGNFTSHTLGSNDGSYSCALADLDGDGDLDIVVANAQVSTQAGQLSGQSVVYLNDGSAGFTTTVNIGSATSYSIDVTVGDIDGDGDIDIVQANGGVQGEPNDVFINDGSANFTREGVLVIAGSTGEFTDNTWTVHLADADNDGDLDLFTGNFDFGPTQSYLFLNDGTGHFSYYQQSVAIGPTQIVCGMAVADLDGDGDVDIAFGDLGQPAMGTHDRITICWNNGSGAFPTSDVLSVGDTPYTLEPADVDGDGDLDLAVGFNTSVSYILVNSPTGFTSTLGIGNNNSNSQQFAFGDIDGDGDLDCVTAERVFFNGSREPVVSVKVDGNTLSDGDTVNVNYNDTLASHNVQISISDPDGDDTSLSCQITNTPTQGFSMSEWTSGVASTPYTVSPTNGTFNQGGVTHDITLTATDKYNASSSFVFHFAVGPSPNSTPTMNVTAGGTTVTNGATLNVNYADTLASLNLAIQVTDADNDNVALTGTVTNTTGTGLTNSEFGNTATAPYTIYPGTGTFNQAGTTHVISLNADDGNGGVSTFSFSISVGAAPTPSIEIYESNVGGTQIAAGAGASGNRDFGSRLINTGASSALTIVINNAGNGDLTVNSISLGGADAGQFVLSTGSAVGTIAANSSAGFTVAFSPTTAGSKFATVTIDHNDGNVSNPFTFDVAGVGTAPAPMPIISVSENGNAIANGAAAGGGRDFGSMLEGTPSAPLTITVSNAGNADLVIGAPVVTGNNAAEFGVTGSGATVPAGQSTTFTVTYLAGTTGTHVATISFTHNDTNTSTPFSFDVAGTTNPVPSNPGSTTGSGSGGGGGCVAGASFSFIGLLFLFLIAGLTVVRNRRVEN